MIENIEKIWKNHLDDDTKKDVIEAIENEWKYKKGSTYLRDRFFYKMLIPKERQERVLEILVNAFKLQEEKKKDFVKELGI